MKKIFALFILAISLCFVGCENNEKKVAIINVEGVENAQPQVQMLGTSALIEIGSNLWYDQSTKIVYFWNSWMAGYRNDTTPSPYYAPNGLPYLFNPETSTFEMIEYNK